MSKPYEPYAPAAVPMLDAFATLTLSQACLAEADAKPLPRALRPDADDLRAKTRALELRLQRRARSAARAAHGKLSPEHVDVRTDQLLGALSDVLAGFARLPAGADDERAEAARTLAAALFPEGVGALTRAPYAAQYQRLRALFAVLEEGKLAQHKRLEKLGLDATVAALRAVLPDYAKLAGVTAGRGGDEPELLRDELFALRASLASWARRVDGSAAPSDRTSQLRARRLLAPLRAQSAEANVRRGDGAAKVAAAKERKDAEARKGGPAPKPDGA